MKELSAFRNKWMNPKSYQYGDEELNELFPSVVPLLSKLKLPIPINEPFLLTEDRKRVLFHLHTSIWSRAHNPDQFSGVRGDHVALFGIKGLGKSTIFALLMYTSAILWGSKIQPIYWNYEYKEDVRPRELVNSYAFLRFKQFPSDLLTANERMPMGFWDKKKLVPIIFLDEFQVNVFISNGQFLSFVE
jgi:hypothetical protein